MTDVNSYTNLFIQGVANGDYDDDLDAIHAAVIKRRQVLGYGPVRRRKGSGQPITTEVDVTPAPSARDRRAKQLGVIDYKAFAALTNREQRMFSPCMGGRRYYRTARLSYLTDEVITLPQSMSGRRWQGVRVRLIRPNRTTYNCEVVIGTNDTPGNRYIGQSPLMAGQKVRIPVSVAVDQYIKQGS